MRNLAGDTHLRCHNFDFIESAFPQCSLLIELKEPGVAGGCIGECWTRECASEREREGCSVSVLCSPPLARYGNTAVTSSGPELPSFWTNPLFHLPLHTYITIQSLYAARERENEREQNKLNKAKILLCAQLFQSCVMQNKGINS